ncbi:MAG: hypothetical protein HYR51_02930 [Candidatus Rokubacteria bacterium]|nr:hypothetical protein [Candidatus Rokubacteria bacterium]
MRGRSWLAAGVFALGLGFSGGAAAAPPDDRVLPPEMHQSDKGRALAAKHARALRDLNAEIYHCMPWVEIQKHSIGFYKPRHLAGDNRYLSIRIYIEQEPSPQFSNLAMEQRAAAMFSRYVGPLLRRMTRHAGVRNDDTIDGFTMILEWRKQAVRVAGERPIHETIAVFLEKVDVEEFLSGQTPTRDLATKARVLAFSGETALGDLRLAAWDDDFVSTFRVQNYQLAPGVVCQ